MLFIHGRLFITVILATISTMVLSQSDTPSFFTHSERYNKVGEFDSSIFILNQALNSKDYQLNVEDKGEIHLRLGNAYKLNREYEKAFKNYNKAESLYKKTDNSNALGKVYVAKIEYYRARRKFTEAEKYIDIMDEFISQNDISDLIVADFYGRRAAVESEGNYDSDQSIFYSKKVLEIAKRINNLDLEGTAYNELGFAYENRDDLETALNYYSLAILTFERDSSYSDLINAIKNSGRCKTKMGQTKEAIKDFQRAIELSESHGFIIYKIETYYTLYTIYSTLEEYDKALEAYIAYFQSFSENRQRINEKELNEIEQKYNLEKQVIITESERQRAIDAENAVKSKTQNIWTLSIFSVLIVVMFVILWVLFNRLKKKNKQLQRLISQKEIILKELHHRVKNNLTILKSILFLQSKSSKNDEVREALNDCQSRINSMSLVHQNAYQTNNVNKVELKENIQQLIRQLEDSILPMDKKINFSIDEESVSLDVSTAVLVGFILNELITNSIKHGMTTVSDLSIGIKLIEDKNSLTIHYWDNGIGLPNGTLLLNEGGFGFKLINIMIKQLKSKMNYSVIEGKPTFSFTIQKV